MLFDFDEGAMPLADAAELRCQQLRTEVVETGEGRTPRPEEAPD